ncbi:hypothetical protein [Pedobacter sp.]|uniref:hypothetical protein n=1 Tax=Pedobacter sp. TaxID=1411316 RepID=UPI003D7F773B
MKKFTLIIGLILFLIQPLIAQDFLNSNDSGPTKMGWMKGFPPPKDHTVSAADGSYFDFLHHITAFVIRESYSPSL